MQVWWDTVKGRMKMEKVVGMVKEVRRCGGGKGMWRY